MKGEKITTLPSKLLERNFWREIEEKYLPNEFNCVKGVLKGNNLPDKEIEI